MRWRPFQNVLIVAALCGLFSQGAFAQMPGTFSPLVATAGGAAGILDCIGGNVTYSGGNTIHTFTTAGSNDFVCPTARTVNYLAVAGGGGGGGTSYSGGGGAGGMVTGTATVAAAATGSNPVVVGAGGLAGAAGQRGSAGGNSQILVPGGAGSFFSIVPTMTNAPAGTGWTGYELRARYPIAFYSGTAPSNGTQLRVTIQGGTAGTNLVNALYCGHAGDQGTASSMNYDGNQVQIKFSGSASVTVPATGSPLVSDVVNFAFSKSKDLICSANWGSNAVITFSPTIPAVWSGIVAGSSNAGGTTTGITGAANYTYGTAFITQIEVLTNTTVAASATGGGGGGSYSTFVQGGSGGSSGGGSYGSTSAVAGTAGQGNAGGFYATGGSGGGGAGAAGANGTSTQAGNGGIGLASTITGASVIYAAGGAGGSYSGQAAGTGGSSIGGNGGAYSAGACTNGVANTGSGGGGISSSGTACNGGSGVVVISYPSGVPNVNCIGGAITTVGANTVHTFTNPGTAQINCVTGKAINYLLVAGGGAGGGAQYSGGGGAGGLKTGTAAYLQPGSTAVIVGAGGAPATGTVGSTGSNSQITTVGTSHGGGGGGAYSASVNGAPGGSGGGCSATGTPGTGTTGEGNNGGACANANGAGGGGGAGAAGTGSAGTTSGGAGGVGLASSITGASVFYAGGGGGAAYTGTGAAGGSGGGGAGATGAGACTAGAANTGGGGGGVSTNTTPCAGGSGIVVASYVTNSTQAPPAGTWRPLISTQTMSSLGAGFGSYHIRTRYNTSVYIAGVANTGNTKFRVTVSGGGATTNSFAGMWCGAAAAADPSMDFDGSQIQVTFSGNNNLNLPSGTVVSDQMTYPFDKTKAFICSLNWSSSSVAYAAATAGINMGSAAGAGASAGASVAGFNVSQANNNAIVTVIEVFGP